MRRQRHTTHGGRSLAPRPRRGGLCRRFPGHARAAYNVTTMIRHLRKLTAEAKRAGAAMGVLGAAGYDAGRAMRRFTSALIQEG